jgi:putative CocE/NonD family hydrolase
MTIHRTRLLAALLVLSATGSAQQPGVADQFDRQTVMITMRDGIRLNTEIFTPKNAATPLPIVFLRTPYGVGPGRINAAGPNGAYRELADDGYIFAFQDIRGRYKSEGTFVMQRAPRPKGSGPQAIDEGTDAYDTIDWLVKNVANNNGRVGMLGVSYDGWTTAMSLLEPHPALKAASPQASPADMFLGDDFHHNGAFRLSYGFEYAAMMETNKESAPFKFDTYDTYDWYLKLGPLSNVNAKHLLGKIPTWNDFVAHPNFDDFWKQQTIITHITKAPTVPTLNVAGWWDQEDFFGPIAIYDALEKRDTAKLNFLVVGPWRHGGWNSAEGSRLGNIDFGSPTSRYYREKIQAPFFAYYLKGKGELKQPEAITFEAGENVWRTWDSWPPKGRGVQSRALYFSANGALSWQPQTADRSPAQFDSYVSDPAKPVPYRARPIQWTYDPRGTGWRDWLTEDQRFVKDRPDVLTYQTEPLAEDVQIAGEVIANLFASTTGSDADWIVKLIDVYPEDVPADPKMSGYHFMVSNEVFRARFRESFTNPKPLVPGQVTPIKYSLRTQSYRFKKRASDHGAGAEYMVPAHRPESADVGAEHFRGQGV